MMNKLFGAKKKEEPKPQGPSLKETSDKLGERSGVLDTKVQDLNKELMAVKKEMVNAKGMRKKALQQKALHILKRRKMYDNQLGYVQNQQFNVDQVAFNAESMQDTLNTMSAMKEAAAAQKEQMAKFDFDQMEDVMDDMADLMADQEEIQDMMSRNFGVEYDENELMDELAELDEEIIGEQLNEGIGLPSYIPQN